MKKLPMLILFFILAVSCNVEFEPDSDLLLYEQIETNGTVMLSDVFVESNSVPAKDAFVFLSGNSTAIPFLYKDTTDKEGRFNFSHKPQNKNDLYVIGRCTDGAGLVYEGNLRISNKPGQSSVGNILNLYPLYQGGTLKVIVQGIDPNQQPVNGVDVYLYTNSDQAESIKENRPEGFVIKKVTNEKGIAFFHDLKSENYFIIGKSGQQLTDRRTANVVATLSQTDKLRQAPVILSLPSRASNGRLLVTVQDQQTTEPLAKVDVYLFTSLVQAETIQNTDGPVGNIDKITTSSKGEALFQNLSAGNYYVAISTDFSATRKPRITAGPVTVNINQVLPNSLLLPIP